jgi:diguanylate cyclase (GGDEF)-like protein
VRVRSATARLGDALAATHDVDLLLRVIVDTAVESTSAAGGWLVVDGAEPLVAGNPDPEGQQIELPLRAGAHLFGTLVLAGPGFSVEDAEAAASFAGEAVIALENARLHQIVERQAASDGLTGLANRRHCEAALDQELARAERFDVPVAFVLADLDDFKAINDRFGHPAGDAVLREFAATVRGAVREVDVAGRWGGEEFALVLPGTDLDGASMLAERVRTALEQRTILTPDGAPIRVTASFGVASAPPAAAASGLVGAADTALYEAKRSGKNRVVTAVDAVPQI